MKNPSRASQSVSQDRCAEREAALLVCFSQSEMNRLLSEERARPLLIWPPTAQPCRESAERDQNPAGNRSLPQKKPKPVDRETSQDPPKARSAACQCNYHLVGGGQSVLWKQIGFEREREELRRRRRRLSTRFACEIAGKESRYHTVNKVIRLPGSPCTVPPRLREIIPLSPARHRHRRRRQEKELMNIDFMK